MIALKISRHPLNQSQSKLKLIGTWSLAFSCALGRLLVFLFVFFLLNPRCLVTFFFVQSGCFCSDSRPSIEMKWRWIIQSRKDNATYSAPPSVNTSMEFVFLCGSKLLCFAVDLTSGWWKKVAWRAKLLLHYRVKRRQKRLSEMHTVTSCRGNPWLSYPFV